MINNTIYLRRKNKIIVIPEDKTVSVERLATVLKNIESLGYILSNSLLETVSTLSIDKFDSFYK